jgi:hypothetical protein
LDCQRPSEELRPVLGPSSACYLLVAAGVARNCKDVSIFVPGKSSYTLIAI